MDRQTLLTVLTAAMLVLAGCAGGSGGDASPTNATTPGEETAAPGDTEDTDDGSDGGTATGTVEFYVSDDPGQIEDFRHLNVTITEIGFERAGPAGDEGESEAGENETDEETANETDNEETEDVENDTDGENETTATESTPENGTGAIAVADSLPQTENETTTESNETTTDGNETTSEDADETEEGEEGEDGEESEEDEKDGERAGWVTHDVDSRTVDLTQLRGDNATLIDSPKIPAGNYSKVFVHVERINATLTDGSSANVKLPSGKLQLNKGFELEPNGSVTFVYDITVFKAGNSGKYILKPVISQSGTDQNVEDVDDREGDEDESESDDEDETEEQEADEEEEADEGEEASGPPEDRGNN